MASLCWYQEKIIIRERGERVETSISQDTPQYSVVLGLNPEMTIPDQHQVQTGGETESSLYHMKSSHISQTGIFILVIAD